MHIRLHLIQDRRGSTRRRTSALKSAFFYIAGCTRLALALVGLVRWLLGCQADFGGAPRGDPPATIEGKIVGKIFGRPSPWQHAGAITSMTCRRSAPTSAPEILKSRRRQLSKSHRVLDIAMAQVSLQRSRIVALIDLIPTKVYKLGRPRPWRKATRIMVASL